MFTKIFIRSIKGLRVGVSSSRDSKRAYLRHGKLIAGLRIQYLHSFLFFQMHFDVSKMNSLMQAFNMIFIRGIIIIVRNVIYLRSFIASMRSFKVSTV